MLLILAMALSIAMVAKFRSFNDCPSLLGTVHALGFEGSAEAPRHRKGPFGHCLLDNLTGACTACCPYLTLHALPCSLMRSTQ